MSLNEIVKKAVAGDFEAFGALFTVYGSDLDQYIAGRIPSSLQSAIAADDIVQDARTKAWQKIGTFTPNSENSFRGWMRRIALNCLIDRVRRESKGGNMTNTLNTLGDQMMRDERRPSIGRQTPSSYAARNEAALAVHYALEQLGDDQRQAVFLKYIAGKSTREISQELGKSEGAIRALIDRGQDKLKEILGRSSQWLSRDG